MAISKVQSVTGNGATLSLNGVVAGNALTLQYSYLRGATTGLRAATPTDSSGAFTASAGDFNPLPAVFLGGDNGVGMWVHENCAAGTHTVTPEANTIIHSTLTEWSGIASSASQDVAKSASTINSNQTSQVTGNTVATAQAVELALICLCGGAAVGNANIGLTDPVTGYTTLQVLNNTAVDISVMHNSQVLGAAGVQSATYNWTDNETQQVSIASIATFKGAASSTANLSSAGVGTATGTGASTAASPLASTGAGTATATGAATASAPLASTGTAVATGTGASTASAAFSSSGIGTAAAVGAAVFGAQGALSSAGVGTASATGAAIAGAGLVAPGVATAIAQVQDATPPQAPQAPSPPIDVGAGGGGNSQAWGSTANRRRRKRRREEEEIMAIAALIAPFLQSAHPKSRHVE